MELPVIAVLLALHACGTPESADACDFGDALPSCDVADACRTSTDEPRADCVAHVGWSWACDDDFRAASGGLTQAGRVDTSGAGELPYSHAATVTITDAATWDDLVADWDPAPAAPDFDANVVVIVQYYRNSTCGMQLLRDGVWVPDGGDAYPVEIYAEWEDASGSCAEVCDMEMRSVLAYEVPRARGWPEVCSRVLNVCE